jgi:hypothetical protein
LLSHVQIWKSAAAAFLLLSTALVGAHDLRPLWSPPVSLNLVHFLVFFRNF